jgi:hypothetical protein
VGLRNYLVSGKNVTKADIWFARFDHQISAKHRLFGRTGGAQNDSQSTLAEAAFPARTINSNPTRTGLISLTSTWTQTLLGEGRISYTRIQSNNYPVSEGFDMKTLGFSEKVTSNVLYQQFPQITVQQYNSGSGLTVSTFGAEEVGTLGGATKTLTPQDNWHAPVSLHLDQGFAQIQVRHRSSVAPDECLQLAVLRRAILLRSHLRARSRSVGVRQQ